MADISNGPVSTLAGNLSSCPAGTMCDNHVDIPAVRRVQGETDSFGCEYNDFCESCYQEYKLEPVDRSGTCDWCRENATDLRDKRDYEEGFYGRVYRVCGVCNDKYEERMAEDLLGDNSDFFDYNYTDDEWT